MNTTSKPIRNIRWAPIIVLFITLLASCTDIPVNSDDNSTGLVNLKPDQPLNAAEGRASYLVTPGESIQEAVDMAGSGGTIRIKPGLYMEQVTITEPNVRIMGLNGPNGEKAVIRNPGGINHGINVRHGAHNFKLSNITVEDFDRNGVFLIGVEGFDIRHVTATNNKSYGIYPVLSSGGTVSHCTASGSDDAGFYIGQASNIRLTDNEAFGNVIGIEASNSDDILLAHNTIYNNSAGILAALLPGRTIKVANRISIRHNRVKDNNLPNFADGGLSAGVPAGSGILAVGVDQSEISHNIVSDNEFLGIAVGSSLALAVLAGVPPEAFADIEPNPDNNRIVKNRVTGNGSVQPELPFPAADLLWDGNGSGNCWDKNIYDVSMPKSLPGCN
jgi:parallel beta-helix repeat protein